MFRVHARHCSPPHDRLIPAGGEEEEHAAEEQIANRMILGEIKKLRAEVAALRPDRAEP